MDNRHYNVLFLCTGNSARSLFAEVWLNNVQQARFTAYSAGSQPSGAVNPYAQRLLESMNLPTDGLRSKSWDEFAGRDVPHMDFVFTVCDQAAAEACPVWPGQPMTAHWGIEDPAMVSGDDRQRMQAFRAAFFALQKHIDLFVNLPLASLDRMRLQEALDDISQSRRGDA